jgi:hypothetical protein
MKRVFALGLLTTLSLAGCSISALDSSGNDSGGAVASAPLKGTIDGKAFVAKSAVVRSSSESGGKASVTIYDIDVACDEYSPKSEREVLTSIEWKAGTNRNFKVDISDLKGSQTATFVIKPAGGGNPRNVLSNAGRIEIMEAPTEKDAIGKLRIRAKANADSVEGEIAVRVCK